MEKEREKEFVVGEKGKKYGLIVPEKGKTLSLEQREFDFSKLAGGSVLSNKKQQAVSSVPKKATKSQIFGVDSDSEDEEKKVREELMEQETRKRQQTRTQKVYAKALEEDPTVFDYDNVYDAIHYDRRKEEVVKEQEKEQAKPKYIEHLLKYAKVRQTEMNILYERKMEKDREVEDHLYGDKEKFVTGAYKKKLEEDKAFLKELEKKDKEDERNDVSRKEDLSEFYSSLLNKNVAFGGGSQAVTAEEYGDASKRQAAIEQEKRHEGEQGRRERRGRSSRSRSTSSRGSSNSRSRSRGRRRSRTRSRSRDGSRHNRNGHRRSYSPHRRHHRGGSDRDYGRKRHSRDGSRRDERHRKRSRSEDERSPKRQKTAEETRPLDPEEEAKLEEEIMMKWKRRNDESAVEAAKRRAQERLEARKAERMAAMKKAKEK